VDIQGIGVQNEYPRRDKMFALYFTEMTFVSA
jgi:hypothetical protein